MVKGLLIAFAAILAICPSVKAGSEQQPELSDPAGDIAFSPLTTNPQDHAYLDILAGWFFFDEGTDEVWLDLKVADARGLADPPSGWDIYCIIGGKVMVEDQVRGNLDFVWEKGPNSASKSLVLWDPAGSSVETTQEIPHEFVLDASSPGHFSFAVERGRLIEFGQSVEEIVAYCLDSFNPLGLPQVQGTYNEDGASSTSAFSWATLRPSGQSDGDDTWPPSQPEDSPSVEGESADAPHLGAMAGLFAISMAAALRKIRRA